MPVGIRPCVVSALALLLILSGCSFQQLRHEAVIHESCTPALSPADPVTGLFVAPDDRLGPILDELNAAVCTIDVSVYLLSASAVINALDAAADRGVRVRVMLEEHPFGGGGSQDEVRSELESHGIEVMWSSSEFQFSHAKFIVVDRQVAIIMNQNLTESAFVSNREFGVVTTEPEAVNQAQAIFDLDWEGSTAGSTDGPLVVSPINSRPRLLGLIDDAMSSIDFYAEVIRDVEVVEALARAEARGVAVRLIVDASIDEDSADALLLLADAGVEIRAARHLYIHAKLMIVDGRQAVVGSQNYTQTSLDRNRELAMVVDAPLLLARCQAIFERDWNRSQPFATGDGLVDASVPIALAMGATSRAALDTPFPSLQAGKAPHSPAGAKGVIPFHETNSIAGPVRGSPEQAIRFAAGARARRLDDVERYVNEIYRLAPTVGFDPAILIAQSALETDSWRSDWWTERLNPAGCIDRTHG